MIFTSDDQEILSVTDELCNLVFQTPLFQEFIQAKKDLESSEEVTKLGKEFQRCKAEFEEIKQYGEFAPGYKEKRKKVYEAKRELDLHPIFHAHHLKEKELQTILDEVSNILTVGVSESIPSGKRGSIGKSCAHNGAGCSCGKHD